MSFLESQSLGELTIRKLKDEKGNIVFFTGSGAGSTGKGYAIGCIYERTDNTTVYVNGGTTTTASWVAVGTISAGSVLLASLASGITPSHVVKFAGTVIWSGAGASLAQTVTGVAATDILAISCRVKGTQGGPLLTAIPSLNTITYTLTGANTSNDYQFDYVVYRAAS